MSKMKCPECGGEIVLEAFQNTSTPPVCNQCGWTADQLVAGVLEMQEQMRTGEFEDLTLEEIEGRQARQDFHNACVAKSKYGIFVFVATCLYLQWGTDMTSGPYWGFLFWAVGMFVVSLGIMMPAMMVRQKFTSIGPVMWIAETAAVIFVTRWVFIKLFG
jgi:hypothetical protein